MKLVTKISSHSLINNFLINFLFQIPPENFTQSNPLPQIYSLLKIDEHLLPAEATSLEEEDAKYHSPDWPPLPTLEACLPLYPSDPSVVSLAALMLQPSLAQDLISQAKSQIPNFN